MRAASAVLVIASFAAQAPAEGNLIVNGTFDRDLANWTLDARAIWVAAADGRSGAVRVINDGSRRKDPGPQGAVASGIAQCVRLSEGTYTLTARARVPGGAAGNHVAEVMLWRFTSPDCSWQTGKGWPNGRGLTGVDENWQSLGTVRFQSANESWWVQLSSTVRGSARGDFEVWFDDVVLRKATEPEIRWKNTRVIDLAAQGGVRPSSLETAPL